MAVSGEHSLDPPSLTSTSSVCLSAPVLRGSGGKTRQKINTIGVIKIERIIDYYYLTPVALKVIRQKYLDGNVV